MQVLPEVCRLHTAVRPQLAGMPETSLCIALVPTADRLLFWLQPLKLYVAETDRQESKLRETVRT